MCTYFCKQSLVRHQRSSVMGELHSVFRSLYVSRPVPYPATTICMAHLEFIKEKSDIHKPGFSNNFLCKSVIGRLLVYFNKIHKKMDFTKEHVCLGNNVAVPAFCCSSRPLGSGLSDLRMKTCNKRWVWSLE